MKRESSNCRISGKPQYGGEMTMRINRNIMNFDPMTTDCLRPYMSAWMERPIADDWTQTRQNATTTLPS